MTHVYQKQNCRNFKIDAECGHFPFLDQFTSSKCRPSLRPEVNIFTCSSPTYTREYPQQSRAAEQSVVHSNLLSLFKYFQSNVWLKIICISLITFRSHFPSVQKSFSLDFQLSQTLEKIIDVLYDIPLHSKTRAIPCVSVTCYRNTCFQNVLILKRNAWVFPGQWDQTEAHTLKTVSGLSIAALG